ncbi:MAG: S24/S26 family peptidase [Bacilli bacterium]|nr:S24/S26 family peptidase [Bacilli bacterium]
MNFEEILEKEGTLVYTCVGVSMLPLLRERKDILTISKITNKPKKYDVVLFKRDSGQYVLHRIVKVRKHDYVLLGDNQWRKEKGVLDRHIIGVLTSFTQDDKIISVNDEKYLRYINKVVKNPFRRIKIFFKDLKFRIKRKLSKKK